MPNALQDKRNISKNTFMHLSLFCGKTSPVTTDAWSSNYESSSWKVINQANIMRTITCRSSVALSALLCATWAAWALAFRDCRGVAWRRPGWPRIKRLRMSEVAFYPWTEHGCWVLHEPCCRLRELHEHRCLLREPVAISFCVTCWCLLVHNQ